MLRMCCVKIWIRLKNMSFWSAHFLLIFGRWNVDGSMSTLAVNKTFKREKKGDHDACKHELHNPFPLQSL